jgi:hypothetical protein
MKEKQVIEPLNKTFTKINNQLDIIIETQSNKYDLTSKYQEEDQYFDDNDDNDDF